MNQGLEMWTPAEKRGRGREKVSKKETLMGKLTENEDMLRRDRTRPRGEESGEDASQGRAETQHRPGKSTPGGGREGLRAWHRTGDQEDTEMRLRHKKGTFSNDENNFLLTSPNRAEKEETKRLLFRPVGRELEGWHRDRDRDGTR